MSKKTAKLGGRPTAYRAEYVDLAHRLSLLGATDAEMAQVFGVSESTFNLWKLKHQRFSESIKRGKIVADADVAFALHKSACGHRVKAVKILQHEGQSYEHEFDEYHPPNPTAAIFILKNRQPGRWRDVNRTEVTGKDGGPVETRSVEELRSELARMGALDAKGRFVG